MPALSSHGCFLPVRALVQQLALTRTHLGQRSAILLQRVAKYFLSSLSQRQHMGSIGTSDPNTLDTSSGSAQPTGAVTLLSEWGADIVCTLWSLWF